MTTSTSSPAIVWPDPADFETDTDQKTGIRHYRYKGGPWRVSSTTALGIIAKGYAYDNWVAGCERDKYDLAIAEAVLEPVAPEYLLAAVKAKVGGRYVYTTVRDKAAGLGAEVDGAVRAYLEAQLSGHAPPVPKLSAEGLASFSTFVAWWQESGLTAVAAQQPLVEPLWNYGGTFDFAAFCPKRGLGILDLKRTKWIGNSYHYQVASYMRAARTHADVTWGTIVKLPKDGRPLEIAELGQGMFGGHRTEHECMQAFKCALDLWRCENPR